MKWILLFCLLAVHQISGMPNKEEEAAGENLDMKAPEFHEEIQEEEEKKVLRKRDAEFEDVKENQEEEEEEQRLKSRQKRYAEGDSDNSEKDLDLDVNVNINAPQPNFKADVDVNVNFNAGAGTTTPVEQYSLCPMCGTRFSDRIVGGQEAALGSWPWMAYLLIVSDSGNYSCGGSIITRDTILTAAHCVSEAQTGHIETILVIVGSVEVSSSENLIYKMSNYTAHENYNPVTFENDIALLKLEEGLTFTFNVRPICIGDTNMIYEGRKIEATGWGLLNYTDIETPTHLQEVTLDIISTSTCQQLYPLYIVDERQVCTLTPNKDACSRDSGGPMVVEDGDRWYELGLVSFGEGCAFPNSPNVATSVPYFKSWILENIGDIICD